MNVHRSRSRQSRIKVYIVAGIAILIVLLVVGVGFIRKTYLDNLKPVSSRQQAHVVTIAPGSTSSEIADNLYAKKAIRSDWAFEWYIRNHQLRDQLKAGTYVVYESQSVQEIVKTLVSGKEATDLVTILPGKRLGQIRDALIKADFKAEEVDAALEPAQYAEHPALTDKPADANLEGYLYPESFQKTAQTTPQEVIKQSLDQMQLRLTPEIRQAYSKQGLTVHQAVILASIVEQEVSNAPDRAQVAQVFLKRYKDNMSLGSDPTAFYGAIMDGQPASVLYDSPYNTRMHAGLPPGPIGNASESSLKAVAFPAQTDWVYFVAGDDGKTHFSKTLQEHEDLTRRYCTKLCGR